MLDTVGKRLKKARKYAGMTQVELADSVDSKQGAISDLEGGRNNSSTKLVQMALVLGVSAEWLSTGAGEMVAVSDDLVTPAPHMIPVLSYAEVLDWFIKKAKTIEASEFEPVRGDYDSPESLYWVRIDDNSMASAFNTPDLVLMRIEQPPQPGDYVLAFVKESVSVIFRKWRSKGADTATGRSYAQLIAVDPDYPVVDSRYDNFKVLGIALEHRIKLR